MLRAMAPEGFALARRLVRQVRGRPELTVRVRIAGAHHRAAVLERERVAHPWVRGRRRALLGPDVDHAADVRGLHPRERQVVPRRETEYPAEAARRLGHEQRFLNVWSGER